MKTFTLQTPEQAYKRVTAVREYLAEDLDGVSVLSVKVMHPETSKVDVAEGHLSEASPYGITLESSGHLDADDVTVAWENIIDAVVVQW